MKIASEYFSPDLVKASQAGLNQLITELRQISSQTIRTNSALQQVRVISDPLVADDIFKSHDNFYKELLLINELGESRISQNGPRWKIMRDYTQPKFNSFMRSNSRELVQTTASELIKTQEMNNGADFLHCANSITISVFFKLLGMSLDLDKMRALLDEARILITLLQAEGWGHIAELDADQLHKYNDHIMAEFLRLCKQDRTTKQFIYGNPIAKQENGRRASLSDFFHNVFAGFETSSAAMTWAGVILGSNQRLQDRLRQAAFDNEFDMISAFISEVLRMFPPFPIVARKCIEGTKIRGETFLDNEYLLVSLMGINRHQDYWEDPQVFRPFRDEFLDGSYDKRAFMTFISGARVCGGRRIAEMEIAIAMAELLKQKNLSTNETMFTHDYALSQRAVLPDDFEITALPA